MALSSIRQEIKEVKSTPLFKPVKHALISDDKTEYSLYNDLVVSRDKKSFVIANKTNGKTIHRSEYKGVTRMWVIGLENGLVVYGGYNNYEIPITVVDTVNDRTTLCTNLAIYKVTAVGSNDLLILGGHHTNRVFIILNPNTNQRTRLKPYSFSVKGGVDRLESYNNDMFVMASFYGFGIYQYNRKKQTIEDVFTHSAKSIPICNVDTRLSPTLSAKTDEECWQLRLIAQAIDTADADKEDVLEVMVAAKNREGIDIIARFLDNPTLIPFHEEIQQVIMDAIVKMPRVLAGMIADYTTNFKSSLQTPVCLFGTRKISNGAFAVPRLYPEPEAKAATPPNKCIVM